MSNAEMLKGFEHTIHFRDRILIRSEINASPFGIAPQFEKTGNQFLEDRLAPVYRLKE